MEVTVEREGLEDALVVVPANAAVTAGGVTRHLLAALGLDGEDGAWEVYLEGGCAAPADLEEWPAGAGVVEVRPAAWRVARDRLAADGVAVDDAVEVGLLLCDVLREGQGDVAARMAAARVVDDETWEAALDEFCEEGDVRAVGCLIDLGVVLSADSCSNPLCLPAVWADPAMLAELSRPGVVPRGKHAHALQCAASSKSPHAAALCHAVFAMSGFDAASLAGGPNLSPPLSVAAAANAVEVCEALLAHGADPDCADEMSLRRRPLHTAAIKRLDGVAEVLLLYGASLKVRDQYGNTPLLLAAKFNADGVAAALLNVAAAAAAATEAVNVCDENGSTPLLVAASNGVLGMIERLLAAGAAVDAADADGATALMVAAKHGHGAVVRRLLAAGADARRTNRRGETAADLAEGLIDCASVLDALHARAPAVPSSAV